LQAFCCIHKTNFGEIEMNVHVCSICGRVRTENQNWYLLAENHWRDRLKILRWDDDLAKHGSIFHACGIDHVRDFLHAWVTSSELPSRNKMSFRPPLEEIQSVENLWVHRHGLKNAPEGLKSLLDAVIGSLKNDFELHENQISAKIRPPQTSFQAVTAPAS